MPQNLKTCCVCGINTKHATVPFHRFPKTELLTKWKEWCQVHGVASQDDNFKCTYICGAHFSKSDYRRNCMFLKKYAVPSILKDTTRHVLFPHAVPSQNIPKNPPIKEKDFAHNNLVPMRSMRKTLPPINDIKLEVKTEPNILESVPDLCSAFIKSEESEEYDVTDASVQVDFVDHRDVRPDNVGWCLADIICDNEPLEKCCQVNFQVFEEQRLESDLLNIDDDLSYLYSDPLSL